MNKMRFPDNLSVWRSHNEEVRKARWKRQATGKSGGIRVIYYWVVDDYHIRMLYVYPKGKQEDLTKQQISQLKAIVERW
jgi:hypothetical protein